MNTKAAVIGGIIGGMLGWLISTIITDEIWPEYYSDEELKEYEEIRKRYATASENILANKGKQEVPKTLTKNGEEKIVKKDYNEKYFEKHPEKAELEPIVRKYNDVDYEDAEDPDITPFEIDYDEEESDDTPETYEEYLNNLDVNTDIHIVSSDDYSVNAADYKVSILHYYEDDDVLADSNLYPIRTKPDKLIGENGLSSFGMFSDDEDVVHLCNPVRGVMYRIIRHEDSYQHAVVENVKHANVFETYDNDASKIEEEEEDDIS